MLNAPATFHAHVQKRLNRLVKLARKQNPELGKRAKARANKALTQFTVASAQLNFAALAGLPDVALICPDGAMCKTTVLSVMIAAQQMDLVKLTGQASKAESALIKLVLTGDEAKKAKAKAKKAANQVRKQLELELSTIPQDISMCVRPTA